jgi:hypothetical protein
MCRKLQAAEEDCAAVKTAAAAGCTVNKQRACFVLMMIEQLVKR